MNDKKTFEYDVNTRSVAILIMYLIGNLDIKYATKKALKIMKVCDCVKINKRGYCNPNPLKLEEEFLKLDTFSELLRKRMEKMNATFAELLYRAEFEYYPEQMAKQERKEQDEANLVLDPDSYFDDDDDES